MRDKEERKRSIQIMKHRLNHVLVILKDVIIHINPQLNNMMKVQVIISQSREAINFRALKIGIVTSLV